MSGRLAALLLAAALALTGCAGDDPAPEAGPSSTPTPTAAPTPAPRPEVGQCHRLTLAQAADPVASDGDPVRCGRRTTSVTVAVLPLDLVDDGHLLDPASDAAAERLARTCPPRLATRWAGGDSEALRTSRLQVVWFVPDAEALDAGADWVRCDLVAVADDDALVALPARSRGLLTSPRSTDVALCGTAAPSARRFERVACSQEHAWRAIGSHDLPRGTRYLGRAATAAFDTACEDQASALSSTSLEFSWALEWPTREQWDAGQRWGWCWVPAR